MKKLLIIICFCPILSFSQSWTGISFSNLGGIHQAYLNPSFIADSRHRLYVNAVGFGTNIYNDYIYYEAPFTAFQMLYGGVPSQYKNSNGNINWQQSWLKENLNGKPHNASINIETRGPGALIKLNQRMSVGVSTRLRLGLKFVDIAEPLIRIAKNGFDSSAQYNNFLPPNPMQFNQTIDDNKFNICIASYQEVAGTFAMVLLKTDKLLLKGGATAKALVGLGTAFVNNRGLDFQVSNYDSIKINSADFEYGYSDLSNFQNFNASQFMNFRNNDGFGLGFDIGASVEYRPSKKVLVSKKNHYLIKAALSLNDIGTGIKYKNVNYLSLKSINPVIIKNDSNLAKEFAQHGGDAMGMVDSILKSNFSIVNQRSTFTSKLPTMLSIQFDYNVFKWFFVGVNIQQSFINRSSIALRVPSNYTVIPRFETRIFEVGVPLGISNDFKNPQLGAFVRFGPVYLGSDNLLKSVQTASMNGLDIYFGVSTGIPSKKKDKKAASK